jgi:6-phosphogluconolactonase
MMNGEIRIVGDVADEFAAITANELAASATTPFALGCSGGGSGKACYEALARRADVDFARIAVLFADERCVDPSSPDANAGAIRRAFGDHADELAAFHPMSCEEGPEPYAALLRSYGAIDLLQLGLGPDGHTASLFPNSAALDAPAGQLVAPNDDPSGRNPHPRLTLTYPGIALARVVVVTVIGADKAFAMSRIAAGDDLPGARLAASRLIWLVDTTASSGLSLKVRS